MNRDIFKADCDVPQDKTSKLVFSSVDGFVQAGDEFGNQENVLYFRQLLAMYPELLTEKLGALWWLAKQTPDSLAGSFQVMPSEITFLVDLILTPSVH